MTNRWHNILGSFADWDKISSDFEGLHKKAEGEGFELKIIDDSCPCCGFRPVVQMDERREKKQGRPKRQPKPPADDAETNQPYRRQMSLKLD